MWIYNLILLFFFFGLNIPNLELVPFAQNILLSLNSTHKYSLNASSNISFNYPSSDNILVKFKFIHVRTAARSHSPSVLLWSTLLTTSNVQCQSGICMLTLRQNPEESKKTVVSVGPFGSPTSGGRPFNDGIHSAVKGLAIEYLEGHTIVNVRFEYDDDGISVWSDKHGEVKIPLDLLSGLSEVLSDNNKVIRRETVNKVRRETIRFNYPDEYLTAVHGRYCDNLLGAVCVVNSLTFKTNRNTYGPFGWTSQNEKLINLFPCFSIHMPGSEIVGFHGRSSRSKWLGGIYSIGAYVKPYHQQIEYPPSKALMLYPSEPPSLPEFHSQTKLNKDDRPQNHKHYTVSNIQVSRNEGDHNGAFHLGDIYANCYIAKQESSSIGYALR